MSVMSDTSSNASSDQSSFLLLSPETPPAQARKVFAPVGQENARKLTFELIPLQPQDPASQVPHAALYNQSNANAGAEDPE